MDSANADVTANVPPEILDNIFKHCERRYKQRVCNWRSKFLPKSRLQPLLLVCRRWHTVAESRLYSSVGLGSNRVVRDRNGQRMELKGKDVRRKFCETVQNNTRIALLVRELRLGIPYTFDDADEEGFEASDIHILLIGICKNVENIELHGCHAAFLDDLAEVLAKADLTSLSLDSRRLGDFIARRGKMLSLSTVIKLLRGSSRLQTLYYRLSRHDQGHEASFTKTPSVQGVCTTLKVLSLQGGAFDQTQLPLLASLTPALEEFSIQVGMECCAILRQCMKSWSSSLRCLTAFTWINDEPPVADACPIICFPMTELRDLWISAPPVPPSAMVFLPKLETLNFRGDYSDGADLIRVIRKGAMPNLREIQTTFSPPKSDDGVGLSERNVDLEIELAQELRKVCAERKTFPRDFFADDEGLDEYYRYLEESPESSDNDWRDYESSAQANTFLGDEIIGDPW
ncbi:hypothetical protein SCHPADRAFT_931330 [Schizopora paradoxa]|uniref:Uncharacterized protein n=1 Tax=Schizopora paradoxa TaxID=27342 RepID=A0A0H2RB68_9AGAM|nr:hypothetical protein SCHPADRAFT_931330 [Schizopora paradoxa]